MEYRWAFIIHSIVKKLNNRRRHYHRQNTQKTVVRFTRGPRSRKMSYFIYINIVSGLYTYWRYRYERPSRVSNLRPTLEITDLDFMPGLETFGFCG